MVDDKHPNMNTFSAVVLDLLKRRVADGKADES